MRFLFICFGDGILTLFVSTWGTIMRHASLGELRATLDRTGSTTFDRFLSLSYPFATIRPVAPRHPRSASSPSTSVSSGFSGSFRWEPERSPRTPLPPPAPMPAPGPVYPIPRTPMSNARRDRSLFSHSRVAPPTPPSPSPSDEEPSEGTVDPVADLEGDLEEPYLEDFVYPAGYDAYSSNASHSSEWESVSAGSAPSSRHSSDDSSGSGSIGYGEASSGSASDCASDDDLVNRHFARTFP
ncbi:hypothetical protein PIB30_024806 [Stylosanthes scabra]|uniref:Uncharacterized protein n=1 Tax=Stylosanthes scabra TaxID=79078 RepID=A0ABU6W9Q1_9FABA|nr:hypothetical protein [Stylosanthes scabra]